MLQRNSPSAWLLTAHNTRKFSKAFVICHQIDRLIYTELPVVISSGNSLGSTNTISASEPLAPSDLRLWEVISIHS